MPQKGVNEHALPNSYRVKTGGTSAFENMRGSIVYYLALRKGATASQSTLLACQKTSK